MTAAQFFSATAGEADLKFRRACAVHGLESRLYTHPKTGPDGETLNLGVCRIGPAHGANRLLVISGTHGVEGYAGAAIQTGWLLHYGSRTLPENTGIVMVHAVNPWGMAWNRRETEDNVDLFRNLIYGDYPSDPDPLFDIVDDMLDLRRWNEHRPASWQRQADELIAEHGVDRLIAAIRRGQHHRPKSMTYHGNGATWSKSRLDEIVVDYLQGARRIAVIDIHTGFGDYGEGIVMSYDPPGSRKHSRVARWFSGDIYTPGADADIPDHRTRLPFEWIESLIAGATATAQILEFGTYDPAEIGEIFNANHHFHIYGDPRSEEGMKWGKRYRRHSYPEEDEWKNRVWCRGREVIELTLAGLNDWSKQ